MDERGKWDDEAIGWDASTGEFDREATIENREWLRDRKRIPRNPPPKKVGKVDPKTIALCAVSDVIDCASWKHAAVLRFYIDSANRGSGNCWPSEETVADKLRKQRLSCRLDTADRDCCRSTLERKIEGRSCRCLGVRHV
jgi:hypothetical protein